MPQRIPKWGWALLAVGIGTAMVLIIAGNVAGGLTMLALAFVGWVLGRLTVRASARPSSPGHVHSDRNDDELLTPEQVADLLGVRRDWVMTLVARDGIPYIRHGGSWWAPDFRFRRSETDEWSQSEEQGSR